MENEKKNWEMHTPSSDIVPGSIYLSLLNMSKKIKDENMRSFPLKFI